MTGDFDGAARPARAAAVAWRVVEGEAVMVLPTTATVHTLNQVGTRFWELADGSRSFEQIVGALADEFEAEPARIASDCRAFLDDLSARGLIELAGR